MHPSLGWKRGRRRNRWRLEKETDIAGTPSEREREGEGITGRTRCTLLKKEKKENSIQFKLINFIYSMHNSGDCLQAALQSGRTKGPSEQPSKEMHLD